MKSKSFWILIAVHAFLSIPSCKDDEKSKQALSEMERKLEEQTYILDSIKRASELNEDSLENSPIHDLSKMYDQYKESVYLIYTAVDDTTIYQGSGFQITDEGIALSNYHVFKDATGALAVDCYGGRHNIEIISKNEEQDVILFRILEPIASALPLANNIPPIGESCIAIGNPRGLTNTLSTGIISSFRDNYSYIQTTAEITHGSSGGPLFNAAGEVIGITTAGQGEANLNFAINILSLDLPSYMQEPAQPSPENKLIDYYTYLFNKDWDGLYNIYAPYLDKFQYRRNVTREFVIKDHKYYYINHYASQFFTRRIDPVTFYNSRYCYSGQIQYNITNLDNNTTTTFIIESKIYTNTMDKIVEVEEVLISKR